MALQDLQLSQRLVSALLEPRRHMMGTGSLAPDLVVARPATGRAVHRLRSEAVAEASLTAPATALRNSALVLEREELALWLSRTAAAGTRMTTRTGVPAVVLAATLMSTTMTTAPVATIVSGIAIITTTTVRTVVAVAVIVLDGAMGGLTTHPSPTWVTRMMM